MTIHKVTRSNAAIVCSHIAEAKNPVVRFAQRDVPEEAADSGWQFFCGVEEENWRDAQVWSISDVLQIAPDLAEFIDLPPGSTLSRADSDEGWIREQ